jgi:hypothetical protein
MGEKYIKLSYYSQPRKTKKEAGRKNSAFFNKKVKIKLFLRKRK